MKALYRCEYCDEMGTEEEILKHEGECIHNRTKHSCLTCKHAENKITTVVCHNGQDVPEGKMIEGCKFYEWDEKDHTTRYANPFGKLFGGIF